MKLKLSEMDENTWITAEGKRIKVYSMDAVHLENTINWLRTHEPGIRLGVLSLMGEYLVTAPDGAADCCQMEMEAIERMQPDEFLIFAVKPYKKMLERYAQELKVIIN